MGITLALNPRVSHAWQGAQTINYLETVTPAGGFPVGNGSLLGWNDTITIQANPADAVLSYGSTSTLTFSITSQNGPNYSAYTRDLVLNAAVQPSGNVGTSVDGLGGLRSTLNLTVQGGQPANNSVNTGAAIIAQANSTGAAGANIAEVAGVRIDTPTIVGPGLPATLYGLSVKAIAGGTANYAIQTATGLVDFGDNVTSSGTVLALNLFENAAGNLALGSTSLDRTTTGLGNTAVGTDSLTDNAAGSDNSGFGSLSLLANTSGGRNTGIGCEALSQNTTGSDNTSIGYAALLNCTTANGNTAIGSNTGIGITTGANNTILGANVTGLAAGLSNNIILANGSGSIKAQHDGTSWLLSGATFTNTVNFNNFITLNAGTRDIRFLTGTSLRWIVRCNGVAESGSNAGSDFQIFNRDDSGGGIGNPISIERSSGNVCINSYPANANAILDVVSTTKAFMPPRMTTTQKNAIAGPTAGMVVYDSTLGGLCVYTTAWETMASVGVFLVANLPAGVTGMRAFVTNAVAGNFRDAVVGGGAFNVPVYFDSLVWRVG